MVVVVVVVSVIRLVEVAHRELWSSEREREKEIEKVEAKCASTFSICLSRDMQTLQI